MVKRNSKLKAYKNKSLRSIERFASSKIENIFENLEALRKRSSFIHLRCRRHSNSEGRRDTTGKTWKATSFKIRSPFGCLWNCIPRNSILESVRHTYSAIHMLSNWNNWVILTETEVALDWPLYHKIIRNINIDFELLWKMKKDQICSNYISYLIGKFCQSNPFIFIFKII